MVFYLTGFTGFSGLYIISPLSGRKGKRQSASRPPSFWLRRGGQVG